MLSVMLAACFGLSASAQYSLSVSSPSFSENFDSMWEDQKTEQNSNDEQLALPSGWKIDRNMSAPRQICSWDEASSAVMYTLSEELVSNAKNGTYCWGATDNKSDRAIGGLSTGSVGGSSEGTRGISVMTRLNNADPDKIITNLNLNYNIEKYRKGNNGSGFSVRVFTSEDGSKWTEVEDLIESFSADNETLGGTPVPLSVTPKTGNLRVHVEPGKDLYLAWNISVTSGTTCSGAPGYAIDDVKVEATFADSDDDWEEEELPDFQPSGIYLRGEINGWAADADWEFSKLSETEYALYNKTLSGAFKVADASWSGSCNYGSNGGNVTMDSPYVLTAGTDTNISCGNLSFPCARILLTIENNTATLLLEPNTKTTGLSAVYMVGDFNDWNYMSTKGKLTLDLSDNLYKGQVALSGGSDGLSHWMIYQRLALAGAWGLDTDATSSSLSGTLEAGKKGHVATAPGMYDVTFNISTGEYSLEPLPSLPQSLILNPAATTLVPVNPDKVKVLSLNNSLIHYNDQAKVFNDIAASMGKDAFWTKHTNLGKTLQYHWDEGDGMTEAGEPGAKMMIRSDAWSHIILQEQTILPRTDFNSFSNSVKQWVEYIRTTCPNPNAVIILPLNWALAQDWSNFSDYNEILAANYAKVAQEFGVVVCPVGLAYQSKYDNDGGQATEKDWFLPGDDRHPTLKATYLAALMEYGVIFNEDPSNVAYYPNYTTEYDKVGEMSDAIAREMRQYASDALKAYKNVVDHHSATINFNAAVLDQYGLEMPGEVITWSVSPSSASITDGMFKANENGVYTVTATSGNLSASATVNVTEAVTEAPQLDFIILDSDNLDYTQDFDSMGTAETAQIPYGWRADGQLTERTLGSYQTASTSTIKASNGENFGSTAKNGVWNFGDSSDLSDRALGGATTDTSGGAKSINIYAAFKNGGSKAISSLDISYNIEKYRGGTNAAGFTVQLYKSVDGLNWTSAGSDFTTTFAPDAATAGADVTPMETRYVTGTLDFNLVAGGELFLAWNISASTGSSCMAAPLLSIDDVEINAMLRPIPVYNHYIYIENQSGYEKTGLYAYSTTHSPSEIFGAWPGQNPLDIVEIDGISYEVFGHNQPVGNYMLIYNNNNNGSQHNDFAIEGGQDYYLRANANRTLELSTTAVEDIDKEAVENFLIINSNSIYCPSALSLSVYNLAGGKVIEKTGNKVNITDLSKGFYVVSVKTPEGNFSKKFLKK